MKLKTSKFKVLAFCCTKLKSQGLYIIKIKYWNASGSGSPPYCIPTLWIIGILHYKQAKLHNDMQHSIGP